MKIAREYVCIAFVGLLMLCSPIVHAQTLAFVDVTVIPMDSERLIPGQTVVIRDGVIDRIGATKDIKLERDWRTVDGHGKYLMPGLMDMHVHIGGSYIVEPEPQLSEDAFMGVLEDELVLYLANGVTSVRNMSGRPWHLKLREAIQQGKVLGPSIYTTGPMLDGDPPRHPFTEPLSTDEQGAHAVATQVAAGYDFIKVYANLSPVVYDAILRAADDHNISVVGHTMELRSDGLVQALGSGQLTVEHLSGFPMSLAPDSAQLKGIIAAIGSAGVWSCPTIVQTKNFVPDAEIIHLETRSEMRFVSRKMRSVWERSALFRQIPDVIRVEIREANVETRRVVFQLHEGGAGLLVGTDAPANYVIPGFSIHDELASFVEAGLPPFAALAAATRDAANALGRTSSIGTVTVGKRADLLLLKANPLQDIANAKKIAGIVLGGQWIDQSELQTKLEAVATPLDVSPQKISDRRESISSTQPKEQASIGSLRKKETASMDREKEKQAAAAELPPIVEQALASVSKQTGGDWSFTKTTVETKTKEMITTIERFDPRLPKAEQWSLVSVDGNSPTPSALSGYRIEKSIEENGERGIQEIVDGSSFTLIEETANELTYEFDPVSGGGPEDFIRHLRGKLVVNRNGPLVSSIELYNEKSFSPGGPLKVKKFTNKITLAPIGENNEVLIVKIEIDMKGKAFGIMKAEQTRRTVFSDYVFVGNQE